MTQTLMQFWGGLQTIGGNIISIQAGNYRIITDFGETVSKNIDHQAQTNLEELLLQAEIPAIEGLYSKERLGNAELSNFEDSDIQTIICLSHLHLDHLGNFSCLPANLPVYALNDVVAFYQVLAQQGLLPNYEINWQGVSAKDTFTFGPFSITFHQSDHDTLGIASIFIETPDLKIIYSGDLRFSGFHPEDAYQWGIEARNWEPDILLLEGTSFSSVGREPDPKVTELQQTMYLLDASTELGLLKEVDKLLEEHSELLFAFNGYPQNIERIHHLAQVAKQFNRLMILDPRYYQLYLSVFKEDQAVQPLTSEIITDMKKTPNKYFLQIAWDQHNHLFDLRPGIYLHSNGEPLGAYDPNYEPFVRAINDKGWTFVDANLSGHANQNDLLSFSYLVHPKIVVPWHTFQPLAFAAALEKYGLNTWLPEYGEIYSKNRIQSLLKEGNLVDEKN